ncbi:TonB-dependent receptor [Gammaproteobacteria bacterium AB-CW1]|uniref:TonB-dependent receptor n=1 Tax=Natronospira elongata TaxID=3110268 RepID=A0AAP6JE62_9GAMM|nr:TonB-dependent receptor [Gammaproteobacteria bacterium AB-CW1]
MLVDRIRSAWVTLPAAILIAPLSLAAEGEDKPAAPLLAAGAAEAVPLNPVVVTATRTEQQVDDSLTSVSVVDRESIQRQQPREFSELLRGRPGVDFVSNGPFGKATSLFLRGTSSDHSLLVVDGVRMGAATTGGASWQYLPPQFIERVEIVRGPRGSVYGPDALGGVIQVFTPEGGEELSPWAEISAGSFGTHQYGAGVSGQSGNTRYNLGANHFHTDGIALREDGERKGFYNSSAVGRISHEFDDGGELGVTSLHSEGRTEFIGGKMTFVHQALGSTYERSINQHWDTRVTLGQSRDEGDTVNDNGSESEFATRRQVANWQNSLFAGDHEILVGLDYLDDEITSSSEYEEDSRRNRGSYAQALLDFAPLSLELGIRHDDNDSFGTVNTANAAVGYRLGESHRIRASWGEGFKAPTFNELYFPGFGNPDLEPEESSSVELGISGLYENWFWDAVAYQTDVDNLIETVFQDGVFLPQNVNEARIRGLEIGAGWNRDHWRIYGSVSYTDPEDRESGKRLIRRAKQTGRLEVDREIGDWSLGGTIIAQSHRFNDADGAERLAGFALLNLRAGWRFAESWNARLVVDNVLDRDYVIARDSFNDFDYQQPGRSVNLSLRYGD